MNPFFALNWIIFWGWAFGITDHPSTLCIFGFVVVGILPPIVAYYKD